MDESTRLWNEVARNFEGLALRLKRQYEQNASKADREPVERALRDLGESLQQGLQSVRDAARDPAVHADVNRLADSLGDALSATFTQISDQLRATLGRRDVGRPAPPDETSTS